MKYLLFIMVIVAATTLTAQEKQFSVYFDFDVDTLNSVQAKAFDRWITANRSTAITRLEGYADSTGLDTYNFNLSIRRIAHISTKLVVGEYGATSLNLKPFGETRSQTGPNAMNRRVTIYYNNVVTDSAKPAETELSKAVASARKGDRLKLPNMNFYNYSDIILPESRPVLNDLLAILKATPKLSIEIQGHICCQVKELDDISLKRAVAVYRFLVNNGIDKGRLSYKSFGSSRPIYRLPEKNEAEKIANRRVEIEILEN